MQLHEIFIRLFFITLFSGIIGYERELNQSHAGLKTHMIVGLSATIIALIQQNIVNGVILFDIANPALAGSVRSDPARLIAQVVSGIGFLGGGTIIVTKKNVSGLTTAASIWSVAGLGLALGMGYYDIAFLSFGFLLFILLFTKRLQNRSFMQRINIEYIGGLDTVHEIEDIMSTLDLRTTHMSYSIKMYGDTKIYSSIFEIHGDKNVAFHQITNAMVQSKSIISIQATNLE